MELHEAIEYNDLKAVEALLEGRASPSTVEAGRTALQLAVTVKDARILDALMQHKDADIDVIDESGRSLLHLATMASDVPGDSLPGLMP